MNSSSQPTVIVGGGFVGLFTALHLEQQNYPHPIILIEPRDRFVFKPLLYELLTGEMHTDQICPLYTELLADRSILFVQDTVQTIDLHHSYVQLSSGQSYPYSKLVLALGSRATYFNTPGASDYAFPLTSDQEAIALRDHLKTCLRQARQTPDPEERLRLLTVAIAGAGPAGVELACALADILPVWYDDMGGNYEELRIVLVNRSGEILKGDINSQLRTTAQRALNQRTIPVELLLDTAVTEIHPNGMNYQQHGKLNFLPAATIAWTAGTEPHPLLKELPVAPEHRNRRGQLQVSPTLQLPGFPEVFVGGDNAYVKDAPQPATAQVAYQQGKAIAHNLQALVQGRMLHPAHVTLRGTLMKLGIGEGVANVFDRFEVKGELGHLIRQGTYLELLPTPAHNAKATAEWFADHLLQRHQPRSLNPNHQHHTPLIAGISAIAASMLLTLPFAWRAAQPQQFQTTLSWTGLPTLLDNLTPSD
ncbi:NAD(P)/FAD-dependent oxidoreductase [Oscillatoria sp. FACHB-1407]|uniref:NAD(P)/FAD-dependent oxidoreductase n=1 Tax=Oscillatoria sp. FACHB-1407 TaxID=2692847 RepID=UPI001682CE0A|nr:NAD(P)/FAD-dependent oxidoreductase [Oscillatoria sp. FACHB-1407]MBD2462689.1 NAD(P)/FAD-dependent oxidoreductase [Oscillatoria sp. FACHB-1407]